MGYALPASIGAKLANQKFNVTCLVGDGSFMMNIQELSTLKNIKFNKNIINKQRRL